LKREKKSMEICSMILVATEKNYCIPIDLRPFLACTL